MNDAARPAGPLVIAALILMASVNAVSISSVVPSLPAIQRDFGTDTATVQLILSSYLIALAVSQLAIGPLADRFGRRPVAFWGLAFYALSCVVASMAPSIGVLLLTRVLQGIGGGAGIVISRAIVRDLYDEKRAASVLGYVTVGIAATPMVAPFLGGLINDTAGWRMIFVVVAVATTAVLILARAVLPETRSLQREKPPALLDGLRVLGPSVRFWTFVVTTGFITATYYCFIGGAPFIATNILGLSPTELGAALLFVAAGYGSGNFVSGRFAVRIGVKRMLAIGNIMTVAVIVLMMVFAWTGALSPWTFFMPMYFVGMGNGIAMPSSIVQAMSVYPEYAGTASGVTGAFQFGAGAIITVVAGAVIAASPAAMSLLLLMIAAATLALVFGALSDLTPR